MKNNQSLLILFLFSIAMTLGSCSSNSDDQPEPLPEFFNLNVGNEWVYKEYQNSYDNLDEYNFTGKIDSVEVISIVNIQGIEFSKLRHKIGNATGTMNPQYNYDYLRVDEFGHLVGNSYGTIFTSDTPLESSGLNNVRHPGDDTSYQNTVIQESGTTYASVYPNANIFVEGNNYTISPFVLEYTSPEGTMPIINKSVESNYQRQIGLVKKTNAFVSSPIYWENRLVSYHLAN